MLDKISQFYVDTMLNYTVGKWCLIFWGSVLTIAWFTVIGVLTIGLASHVGWIGAIVILVLICIGLLSIYAGFVHLFVRLDE